jgi:hypothetical protein
MKTGLMKHVLIIAATALVLALAPLGGASDQAFARGGWHGGGGNWHGGGGNWHGGGGWHGGGRWHGGGGCWNCGGWGGGWGWGWGPAIGLGLGYGAWGYGASRVCEPVFRNVRVHTSRGWRWRNVYVGDRCYWANGW